MQPAWPKGEERKRSFRVQTSFRIGKRCDAVSLHWTKTRHRRTCGEARQEDDGQDKAFRSNGLGMEKGKVENKERWFRTIPLYSLQKKIRQEDQGMSACRDAPTYRDGFKEGNYDVPWEWM